MKKSKGEVRQWKNTVRVRTSPCFHIKYHYYKRPYTYPQGFLYALFPFKPLLLPLCNPSKTPDPSRRVRVSKGSNFSTPTLTPHQPLAQGSGVFKPLLFTKYNSASSYIWTKWWPFCGLCIWWCGSSFFIRHSGVSHFFSLFLIYKGLQSLSD